MKHRRIALALLGGLAFLATAGLASADTEVTQYQGSREALRQMCEKLHGELIETASKTRCRTVTGVTYICKTNGTCTKQTHVSVAFDPMKNGGSLNSNSDIVAPKAPEKT